MNSKTYNRAYYVAHKEAIGSRLKRYYTVHRKEMVEQSKKYYRTPHGNFNHHIHLAKRRKIEWRLTEEQFLSFWQQPCSYCGDPIETVGLDRVNSSVGYLTGNVVSCCAFCNYMKNNHTKEELLFQCRKILDHAK